MPPGILLCPDVLCANLLQPGCPDAVIHFLFFSSTGRFCPDCTVCPDDCLKMPNTVLVKGACYTAPFICGEGEAEAE